MKLPPLEEMINARRDWWDSLTDEKRKYLTDVHELAIIYEAEHDNIWRVRDGDT